MNIHHYGIEVRRLREAVFFYKKALGMRVIYETVFMEERLMFLQNEHLMIELVENEDSPRGRAHVAYKVEEIQACMDQLKSKGYHPSEGPYRLENGWLTVFYESPSGELVEFVEEREERVE